MPEYSLSHRYSEFTSGADPATFLVHLKDEMIASGWTLFASATNDYTLDSGAESVNHDKLRVRIYSALEGSNPIIRANVLKPWASGNHPRTYCLDTWVMCCSISKFQVCFFKKTSDGAHQGRYGYFGVLKKPAYYESAGYLANAIAVGFLTAPDEENWRNMPWYRCGHNAEHAVSRLRGSIPYTGASQGIGYLPYLQYATQWAVSDDLAMLEPNVVVSNHPMARGEVVHGRMYDSLILAGQYPAGQIITYDSVDWICLTENAGNNMSVFFLAENL